MEEPKIGMRGKGLRILSWLTALADHKLTLQVPKKPSRWLNLE